jgi:hypothetical protein
MLLRTMSTEWGYITNDERLAVESTDMMPCDHFAEAINACRLVMEGMMGDMGERKCIMIPLICRLWKMYFRYEINMGGKMRPGSVEL